MFISCFLIIMTLFVNSVSGVAPNIDLSHNMRILKLPMDTKVGSIIYRLRGSDADNQNLTFGVRGDAGNQLLEFRPVTETRANVFLKSVPTEKEYKLTIYVTDGTQTGYTLTRYVSYRTSWLHRKAVRLLRNPFLGPHHTTEVESTIIITNSTKQSSPFLEYDPLITVSELTEEKEVIGTVVVRKRNSSSLPVQFELDGSDKFVIRYVISPLKEATKAELSLRQKLDYEKQNLYPLNIYALNPWTDEDVDTRNVAVQTILVSVRDAQDTPPVFHPMPPVVRVSDSLSVGDVVTQVTAEDGDYGNQRNVTYSFVPGSQGVTFFNIQSRTGIITLAASIDLLRETYSTSGPFVLSIKATEVESELIPGLPSSSEATLAVVLVNTENRAPRFMSRRYVATVEENSPSLTPVVWEGPEQPRVVDDDQGKNGSFRLFLEDDQGTFTVLPARGMNELNFALLVNDPKRLDYETSDTKYLEFKIRAEETASSRPLSATTEIRVKLLDANDNIPVFSQEVYNVTLPEDAPPGTVLVKIQATDEDSGSYGIVRYTAVNGPIAGNLRLDPVTGDLTLVSAEGLDRERVPEYTLTVEARDDQGKGNRNMAEVRVVLADANDNAPVFLQPRYDAVLNPDMKSFYETLRVKAYDSDGPGPNSNITYEIVNGNYQEKFQLDSQTGELGLRAPLVANPETQDHGLPVITLTVRAHDQGVPVRSSTVKVQVHNQEYLNRSISFIVPLSARQASERKQDLERGFSTLTGAHVNVHSVAFHNQSSDKSIVRCWVSYPLSSTVDLSNVEILIGNLLGRDYYLTTTNVEAINRNSFDIVFWLLIALVILMILAILALFCYCCCVKSPDGRDIFEMKNKVAPEETVIHYKENGTLQTGNDSRRQPDSRTRTVSWQEEQQQSQGSTLLRKNHARGDEERPSPHHRERQATVHHHDTLTTSYAQNPDDAPVRGAYYQDGGIPVVAGGRMERAYRRGRPLSPSTEMLVHEMAGDSDARRLGNYVVVRKMVRPRVRTDHADESSADIDDAENGPRRTEILYIRSPMREEDDDRHYVRDGELLRSVSETALNTESDSHLRVPRAAYRQQRNVAVAQRAEPPNDPAASQLKFSRYHRTEGDVIISDEPIEMDRPYAGPEPPWGTSYHQGEYSRTARQPYERFDGPEFLQRMPVGEDYRNVRFAPEPLPHGYIPPAAPQQRVQPPHQPREFMFQPSYREQYEQERQLPPPPLHPPREQPQLQRTQQVQTQQALDTELVEPQPPAQWSTHSMEHQQASDDRTDPDDDDSKTVIMAPGTSVISQGVHPIAEPRRGSREYYQEQNAEHFQSASEQQEEAQEQHVTFQDMLPPQDIDGHEYEPQMEPSLQEQEQLHDEQQQQFSEEQYRRKDSLRVRSQPLSTEDSGALSGKDKLGPDDTDVFDSRETHEESDRLGPRTTEDEISRTEDRHHTDGDDEDSDSGIGKDGTALRLKKSNLMEKKSLFTIAYDGMQTRGLKSAGERDDSP